MTFIKNIFEILWTIWCLFIATILLNMSFEDDNFLKSLKEFCFVTRASLLSCQIPDLLSNEQLRSKKIDIRM